RKSAETLRFPGNRRKRHAQTTESSEKSSEKCGLDDHVSAPEHCVPAPPPGGVPVLLRRAPKSLAGLPLGGSAVRAAIPCPVGAYNHRSSTPQEHHPPWGRSSLFFFLGGFISWHCPGCSAC